MTVPRLDPADVRAAVEIALAEDVGKGDITTQAIVPAGTRLRANIVARQPIVVAGMPVAVESFRRIDRESEIKIEAPDGSRAVPNAVIARLAGDASAILFAERTALNFLQTLSGIATFTRKFVDRIEGTGAVLLDTRKTLPGLRALSKYATAVGGATNHRMRLDDGVLIKDNHIAVAGGVAEAVRRARARGLKNVQIECDTVDQVAEAIAAGADRLLFDNMSLAMLRDAVAVAAGRVPLEASGGVTLETIRDIAETGVDFISVGAITMSAPAVDIGLDLAND